MTPQEIPSNIAKSPMWRWNEDSNAFNYRTFAKEAVKSVWTDNMLYEICAEGHINNLEQIKRILEEDPWKHLRDKNDPEHLINRKGMSK